MAHCVSLTTSFIVFFTPFTSVFIVVLTSTEKIGSGKHMKKTIIKALVVTLIVSASFTLFAHNKVVVIPLSGDDAPTSKTIFWTNDKYDGNLGGLPGADDKCQSAANTAGVTGRFQAWIGSGNVRSTSSRPSFAKYDLPYKNVDGTLVAESFNDFLDGEFSGVIKSETSALGFFIGQNYWSGLRDNGYYYGFVGGFPDFSSDISMSSCDGWRSDSDVDSCFFVINPTYPCPGTFGNSAGGVIEQLNWSNQGTQTCNTLASLLCFEQ